MGDFGAGGGGVGEEADFFGDGFGVLDGGDVGGEDVGVVGVEGETAAGLGDAGEEFGVGVHVTLFEVELGEDF